jgi:hypothetical protein
MLLSLMLPAFTPRAGPILMCSSQDDAAAARQRWLERVSQQRESFVDARRSTEDAIAAQRAEREEARKRMLAAMGKTGIEDGSAGSYFGYGQDDTDYGYGPPREPLEPAAADDADLPMWMTRELPEGLSVRDDAQGSLWTSSKAGFDGRHDGWMRKPEMEDPNPPPVPGTLRAPGQANVPGVPVQNFMYDFLGGPGEEPPAEPEAMDDPAFPYEEFRKAKEEYERRMREGQ